MADKELYTTIVGLKNYEGNKVFKIGSIVRLSRNLTMIKTWRPLPARTNILEKQVTLQTALRQLPRELWVQAESNDKIGDVSYCEVKFVSRDSVIAKVLSDEKIDELKKDNVEDTFFNPEIEWTGV